jgi:branched-subunit amino acid ABC-type transport system permease component
VPFALGTTFGCLTLFFYIWNTVSLRIKWSMKDRPAGVFLTSLGISVAAAGATGLIRGPGVLPPPVQLPSVVIGEYALAGATVLGLALAVSALGAVVVWRRSVSGWCISLLEQNNAFAAELGVEADRLALPVAGVTALCLVVTGTYVGLATGSSPEIGMSSFLFGIGAAFMFNTPRYAGVVAGAVIFGLTYVALQAFVSPPIAAASLFTLTAVVVVSRGTPRLLQGVR